jgi:putative ABC transport system ATP-binding protein
MIESKPRKIVDNVSVSFCPGCIFNILGPSGAGKSSLLRLINRLDEPSSGEILFDGTDYRALPPCDLRRQIGYLFQIPYLFRGTIEDNLTYADPAINGDRADQLLGLVSIDPGRKKQSVANMSVGEKQRIALARLLATNPRVILLDEPTAALDPTHTEKIEEAVKLLSEQQHLTVVMVSHNPLQAVRMGGQGLLMVSGRLVEQAEVAELIERPQTEEGRRYRRRELS